MALVHIILVCEEGDKPADLSHFLGWCGISHSMLAVTLVVCHHTTSYCLPMCISYYCIVHQQSLPFPVSYQDQVAELALENKLIYPSWWTWAWQSSAYDYTIKRNYFLTFRRVQRRLTYLWWNLSSFKYYWKKNFCSMDQSFTAFCLTAVVQ